MWKILWLSSVCASAALAQMAPSSVEFANLREDVRGLSQRVGEMSLRLEQLERENHELRARASASDRNYVTLQQLNQAVEDLQQTVRSAVTASKQETLQHVAAQIEKLGRQTNAALESMAKTQTAPRPAAPPTFSEDYAKEGVSYTVVKGDSLASIAKKTGARLQDIVNANKISDPSRIAAGQTLFIPNPPTSAK